MIRKELKHKTAVLGKKASSKRMYLLAKEIRRDWINTDINKKSLDLKIKLSLVCFYCLDIFSINAVASIVNHKPQFQNFWTFWFPMGVLLP